MSSVTTDGLRDFLPVISFSSRTHAASSVVFSDPLGAGGGGDAPAAAAAAPAAQTPGGISMNDLPWLPLYVRGHADSCACRSKGDAKREHAATRLHVPYRRAMLY